MATGKHLAQHCREQYSLGPRLLLWVMAEVAIIGSGEWGLRLSQGFGRNAAVLEDTKAAALGHAIIVSSKRRLRR